MLHQNIWNCQYFIYSLCCYECFLFVHNLNTTNKNIFQLKINPKNKKSWKNDVQIKITHINIMSK